MTDIAPSSSSFRPYSDENERKSSEATEEEETVREAIPHYEEQMIGSPEPSQLGSSPVKSFLFTATPRLFCCYFAACAIVSFYGSFGSSYPAGCPSSSSSSLDLYLLLNGISCCLFLLLSVFIEKSRPPSISSFLLSSPSAVINWLLIILIKQLFGALDFANFIYGNIAVFSTDSVCRSSLPWRFGIFSMVTGYLSIVVPIFIFLFVFHRYKEVLFQPRAEQKAPNPPASEEAIKACPVFLYSKQTMNEALAIATASLSPSPSPSSSSSLPDLPAYSSVPASSPTAEQSSSSSSNALFSPASVPSCSPLASPSSSFSSFDPLCAICYSDYEEGEELVLLPCLHIFHSACCKNWLKIRNFCPFCKKVIEVKKQPKKRNFRETVLEGLNVFKRLINEAAEEEIEERQHNERVEQNGDRNLGRRAETSKGKAEEQKEQTTELAEIKMDFSRLPSGDEEEKEAENGEEGELPPSATLPEAPAHVSSVSELSQQLSPDIDIEDSSAAGTAPLSSALTFRPGPNSAFVPLLNSATSLSRAESRAKALQSHLGRMAKAKAAGASSSFAPSASPPPPSS